MKINLMQYANYIQQLNKNWDAIKNNKVYIGSNLRTLEVLLYNSVTLSQTLNKVFKIHQWRDIDEVINYFTYLLKIMDSLKIKIESGKLTSEESFKFFIKQFNKDHNSCDEKITKLQHEFFVDIEDDKTHWDCC